MNKAEVKNEVKQVFSVFYEMILLTYKTSEW